MRQKLCGFKNLIEKRHFKKKKMFILGISICRNLNPNIVGHELNKIVKGNTGFSKISKIVAENKNEKTVKNVLKIYNFPINVTYYDNYNDMYRNSHLTIVFNKNRIDYIYNLKLQK